MMKFPLVFILLSLTSALYAESCKTALKQLIALYPNQSKKMMVSRVENAKNKHMFMRAFIPYYYKEAFKIREKLPVYNKLHKHVGQIMGDAHVGNFGFMVDNKGKSVLTINDFDDVAEAPLFLDVMRLSQSASYVGDFKQARLLEAYKRGLTGGKEEYSDYVSALKVKSQKGNMTTKAEFTQTPKGIRFAVKTEPTSKTTKKEILEIEKILKSKFGKDAKLHDSYSTMKESGGSAYGTRYHALMEMKGNIHFVEFKEAMDGGVVESWLRAPVSNEERILNARKTFLGDHFNETLDVVKIEDRPFQLRFKAKGNKSIDVKAVDETQLGAVIEDEFFTLGQLHRKSLGNSDIGIFDYLRDFNTVDAKEWEESVQIMRKKIKKVYDITEK